MINDVKANALLFKIFFVQTVVAPVGSDNENSTALLISREHPLKRSLDLQARGISFRATISLYFCYL